MLCLLNKSKLRLPVKGQTADELRNRRKKTFPLYAVSYHNCTSIFFPTIKLLEAFDRVDLCKRSEEGFLWKLHCINLRSSGLMMCAFNFYSVTAVGARELGMFLEKKLYGHRLWDQSRGTSHRLIFMSHSNTLSFTSLLPMGDYADCDIWGHPYPTVPLWPFGAVLCWCTSKVPHLRKSSDNLL